MRECLDFRRDESCSIGSIVTIYGKKFKIVKIEEAFTVGNYGTLRAYVEVEPVSE
jgi:hypothetical protein